MPIRNTSLVLVILCLVLTSFNSTTAQMCPHDIDWTTYMGDQLPDDLSYSHMALGPFAIEALNFTLTNEAPDGGASSINNSVSQEYLGNEIYPYVMSLKGDQEDYINASLKFSTPIQDFSFKLLDIDRHSLGTWTDSVSVKIYSGSSVIDYFR